MDVYKRDFKIEIKDDQSPLTDADKRSHRIIFSGLRDIFSNMPVLSEEGQDVPYKTRSRWVSYWLVDPLDGTKEFIKKNDEFTVNIALVENHKPIFGVVYAPALKIMFWGGIGLGSYKQIGGHKPQSIYVNSKLNNVVQIAVSRSHPSEKMNKFISQFDKYFLHPMGSSLKICSVSDGTVDLYPRLGPTMEWDTAAAHAIVCAAGGELINMGTNLPLKYNKENLLNPKFIAGCRSSFKNILLV